MRYWSALLKCTAFVLLFGAAIDIFVVDLIAPNSCDDAASQGSAGPQADHDCFCCCAHLVLTTGYRVQPVHICARGEGASPCRVVSTDPGSIDHPPRI